MHRWLLPLICGLTCGFVLATVGITLFPKLGLIAQPFVCDGSLAVAAETTYKPGQWSGTPIFVCGDAVVTYKVMLGSYLIYSAILLGLFKGLQYFRKK